MKVLYVSHTSTVGGGELSLLELVRALPSSIEATAVLPPGRLAEDLAAEGVRVDELPAVDVSFRLRASVHGFPAFARALRAVRRIARESGADVVHANSVRAGLLSAAASAPVVVSVRDCLPGGAASTAIRRLIGRRARVILANSEHTARRFALPRTRAAMRVAYPPIAVDQFDRRAIEPRAVRSTFGIDDGRPVLGVIGQLTPWKGQDDAIAAFAHVRRTYPDAVLLVVGAPKFTTRATRHDNDAFADRLRRLARRLDVADGVRFLGERDDVPAVLAALDVLLVPSWEEPFGRVVVEAIAMETPVVATNVGGPAETIRDGIDGVLLPPHEPSLWGEAVTQLLADSERRERLAAAGRLRAPDFAPAVHAADVLDAYVLATGSTRR